MRINMINSTSYNNGLKSNNSAKTTYTGLLKPLDNDIITFTRNEKNTVKRSRKKTFLGNALSGIGQIRAKKLEQQAKEVKHSAARNVSFSYVGYPITHSKETITDGVELGEKTRKISQVYNYEDGTLVKAEFDVVKDLKTGVESIGQIFKFRDEKLFAVYEKMTKFPDGTNDYLRKYEADEEGRLKCVYNRPL